LNFRRHFYRSAKKERRKRMTKIHRYVWLIPVLLAACTSAKALPAAQPENPQQQPPTVAQPANPQPPVQTVTPTELAKSPASTAELQPWEPRPSDNALQRGNVYIDTDNIVTLESSPAQFHIKLEGSLPTPCHQLRVQVNPPAGSQQINIEAYSVVNPDRICAQVLAPFNATVPLKDLPAGAYTVLVNGEKAGEIVLP
jgi:hypothetical protein